MREVILIKRYVKQNRSINHTEVLFHQGLILRPLEIFPLENMVPHS